MPDNPTRYPSWLPGTAFGFVIGMVVFGLASGIFTGGLSDDIETAREQGFTTGYATAQAESAAVDVQQSEIHIISNAVFMDSMEVELKAISRLNNAIEFTYGEKGGGRERVPALHPGSAIAQKIGSSLYVIKNVSVAANLQRATIEVTRIKLPTR